MATVLREKGIERVVSVVAKTNTRFKKNPFQETAVHMLTRGSRIDLSKKVHGRKWFLEETTHGNIWYMWRGGEELSDATHAKDGSISINDIIPLVDKKPIIAIYLGFYYIHTSKERRKLHMQLRETVSAVRHYLWDLNVVLIAPSPIPPEAIPSRFVKLYRSMESVTADKIVLLDPNATDNITSEEIMNSDMFIFGGIVDKEIPRRGITSLIPCPGNCVRRRITLDGSIVGVPSVVHKLVMALLKARYEYSGDIKKAIIETMGSKDKKWRLVKEMIWAYRAGEDPLERLLKMARLLRASQKEVREAISMSGLKIDVGRSKGG